MSFAAERASFESKFANEFNGIPAADIVFDNRAYTPTTGLKYARFTIKDGDSQRMTIYTREHRFAGVVIVQIFTPFGEGSAPARVLADEVVAVFQDQKFDGITCRSPYVTIVGQSGDFFQTNVTIPFQRDEVFA